MYIQEPAVSLVDPGCSASVDMLDDDLPFAGEEAAAAQHANLPWIGNAVAAEHPHLQSLLVCKAVTRQAVPAALFLHHPFSQTTSVVLPKGATPILLHEVILVPAEDQLVVTAEANSSRLKVDMFIPSALSWDTLKTMQKWKLQELVYVPAHTELPPGDCCLIMRHLAAMVTDGCAEGADPDELHPRPWCHYTHEEHFNGTAAAERAAFAKLVAEGTLCSTNSGRAWWISKQGRDVLQPAFLLARLPHPQSLAFAAREVCSS